MLTKGSAGNVNRLKSSPGQFSGVQVVKSVGSGASSSQAPPAPPAPAGAAAGAADGAAGAADAARGPALFAAARGPALFAGSAAAAPSPVLSLEELSSKSMSFYISDFTLIAPFTVPKLLLEREKLLIEEYKREFDSSKIVLIELIRLSLLNFSIPFFLYLECFTLTNH